MATSPVDAGIAFLAIEITLYGFIIVYYVFSRGLFEEEKTRIEAGLLSAKGTVANPEAQLADKIWRNYYARAALVDIFLVLCTLVVAFSLIVALFLTSGLDPFALTELGLFAALVAVVVLWMAGVGRSHLLYNLEMLGKQPGVPAGFWPRLRTIVGKTRRPL